MKALFALIAPMPERHFFSVQPTISLTGTANPSKPWTVPSPEISDVTPRLTGRSVLAAAYAQLDRRPDAERERNTVMRIAPFLDAERFASQFGTQTAHDHMLEGLKKAGFH